MGRMAERWAELVQDADLTTVGGRLRNARMLLELTQQELSDAMPSDRRKTRASIAAYELNGSSPSLEALEDLALILGEDPRFLAFGGSPDPVAQSVRGQQVPVRSGGEGRDTEYAVLPTRLLNELAAAVPALSFVMLSIEAPAFGVKARDFLLVDGSSTDVKPDGQLYAVSTTAGAVLIRSEPLISPAGLGRLHLTSGNGASYEVLPNSLVALGKLVAVLQRRR